jgi:hypothetical protein
MKDYEDFKKEYSIKQKQFNLPDLDELQIMFNSCVGEWPKNLILYDLMKGMSRRINYMALMMETIVSGQIRHAALYEIKMLTLDDRRRFRDMWGKLQSKIWLLNKSVGSDEKCVAEAIKNIHNFWKTEFMPFSDMYFEVLEKRWANEKIKNPKDVDLSYYE